MVTGIAGILALIFYKATYDLSPGGLSGGSVVGMWYGVIGTGLMIYAGLLSALRRVPRWWRLGARKTWLRGHIWLGGLSVVFILCHSGFRWGGPVELVLWIVLLGTLVTGIYGLVLQQVLPRLITARIACEAPYDQIPLIHQKMLERADRLISQEKDRDDRPIPPRLKDFYVKRVRPYLAGAEDSERRLSSPGGAEEVFAENDLTPAATSAVSELQELCYERSQLLEQERLYHWLHGWLFVHIPLSIALLVLGGVHIVMSLYY